jgi:hypothetical protein
MSWPENDDVWREWKKLQVNGAKIKPKELGRVQIKGKREYLLSNAGCF